MSDRTSADGALRRIEGVWPSPVHDRAVLYNEREGKALVLNPTGAALWEALEFPRTAAELATLLTRRFPDLPADRARADVGVFLERLLAESVLQPVS